MSDIAQELSRRASPRYIGEQAKEAALNKTTEWKEQITSSPLALGLIGGALGAAIGGSLARGRRTRTSEGRWSRDFDSGDGDFRTGAQRYRRDRDFGDESDSGGAVAQKLADGAQQLKEKAGDVVARARDHIPSASEITRKADDNPMLVALGGLALGAVAALLLPVSRKERELLEPVKQRAGEAIGQLGEKIGDTVQQAQERIGGSQPQPSEADEYPDASTPHPTH